MTINRRTVAVGLATLGLVGLTGGGIAWANTDGAAPWTSGAGGVHCAGGYGMANGDHSPMTSVSDYLGLSRTDLLDEMDSGKTLAEIARDQGKTVAGLKHAMAEAMERIWAADSGLSAAQRTALLTRMKAHLDDMVNGPQISRMHADGWDGMMHGFGRGMMGGSRDDTMGWGTGMMGR